MQADWGLKCNEEECKSIWKFNKIFYYILSDTNQDGIHLMVHLDVSEMSHSRGWGFVGQLSQSTFGHHFGCYLFREMQVQTVGISEYHLGRGNQVREKHKWLRFWWE